MTNEAYQSAHGALLGTIVGDAIGLPYEALSPRRGRRLFGPADRHRFLFGHGMMSDDGEHACMTLAAVCTAGGDAERFGRSLGWRLRWWLLGVPAGIGGATLRATIKLWLGVPPHRSGVFSAGNGPAMRAAVLGAVIDDLGRLRDFIGVSTRLTHTDPKAEFGALAVAVAARQAKLRRPAGELIDAIRDAFGTAAPSPAAGELLERLNDVVASRRAGETTDAFAAACGPRGVSGYVYHTVPVALHAWLSHPTDYAAAVTAAVHCGGDADTVAAITGGIVAAGTGADGIPVEWRSKLFEWPCNAAWLNQLASAAIAAERTRTPTSPPAVGPRVIVRNAVFLTTVFVHLGRRALPPYA